MTTSMIVSYTPWAPRFDVEAAGRILDQIEVPEGQVPLVIAFGDDAGPMLYVHFRPLSRTQLREYGTWARQAGFHQAITSYHPSRKAFQVAAKARWPRAVVLYFYCTCCDDDLVNINACGYCRELDGHHVACPCLLPGGGTRESIKSPQFAAHLEFEAGYAAAKAANTVLARNMLRRQYYSPGTPLTWRLGVVQGREYLAGNR